MPETRSNQRRAFLKNITVLGGLASIIPGIAGEGLPENNTHRQDDGFTFLFQGDSITDGNRTRNNDWNHVLGHGYQYIIASRLWYDLPAKGLHFFNRGISGNTITDLTTRWQKDTLDIKPDVLSILIGINDISALIKGDNNYTTARYEKGYSNLLQQTKLQLPGIQFVLCEPFILPVGKVKEQWELYSAEIKKRQDIVKRLSEEHKAVFVGFQDAFDKALSRAPADYWIWDGIHPMPAGHELMAREWIKQVGRKLKFIKGNYL